ncbi:TraR/DksA family transcriptional regulator [Actinomadura kijaniata]|uniref:RNA polymerase-binding protein DksA n=1 Tax=Actinomadura namibiensis TaxID=182080 RepID=A0A7W3LSY5_ACTNM|nr:RNA polymerase-binding protein DksA [Actinomadura namibiensis]
MPPALSVEETAVEPAVRKAAPKTPPKPAAKKPAAKKPAGTKSPAKPAGRGAKAKPAAKPAKAGTKAAAKNGSEVTAGQVVAKAAVKPAVELPVRADEDSWTEAELAEVRATLEAEMAALVAEIAHAESTIAEDGGGDGAGDDQADAGAKTYEREHEMALAHNARDLLVQCERAVRRMDAGTYGVCESCTRPIGKARLQAFPRATMCVACKQREERR